MRKLIGSASRGQTLVETAVAIPIFLAAVFGIIYFSQFGVANERANVAVRYAGITAFLAGNASTYSAKDIYANLNPQNVPAPCPTPPGGALNNTSPFAGPQSASYWVPAGTTNSSCAVTVLNLGGAQFLSTHYFAATTPLIGTSVTVPSYLTATLGNAGAISATESFVHAAWPGIIMYCSKEVNDRVVAAITASGTAPLPTPIPTASASPAPIQNNGRRVDSSS